MKNETNTSSAQLAGQSPALGLAPGSPPEPLPCRLNKLYQELKTEEKRYHEAGNDEGKCAVYAAAERLKEVVNEFFRDVKAWQAKANNESRDGAPDSNPNP